MRPQFYLESAAFVFHINSKIREYRIVASSVFLSPAVGFWLAPFSQPQNGAPDTRVPLREF
jgi:hypothetical protein